MRDAPRHFLAAYDARHARPDRTSEPVGVHDALQVLLAAIDGDEKRRGLAVDERAADRPFVDAPLLGHVRLCKWIARVQPCIPERDVKRAVIGVAAGLGDDLDAPAARTLELRGIR